MQDTTMQETGHQVHTPQAGPLSRRRFFALGATAVAVTALAACGDDDDAATPASGDTTPGQSSTTAAAGGEGAGGEAEIVLFAAGLEKLAVETYTAGLEAATAGKLGTVPPAVAEFATTALEQHQAALDALTEAGGGEPTDLPDVKQTIDEAFAGVKDVAGLAELALNLELTAAATYQDVLSKLESPEAITLAGSILTVERQHAAVLHFVLGQYPVPEVFASTKLSVAP